MEDGAGREQGNLFSFVKSDYMRICCCLLLRIWDALASKMRESAEPRYEADTGSDTSIHLSLQIIRLIAPKHFNISPHQSFWCRNYSSKSLIIVFYFHSCIGATVSVYFQQSRSSIQTLVLLLFFHQSCEMLRIWWIYPCKKNGTHRTLVRFVKFSWIWGPVEWEDQSIYMGRIAPNLKKWLLDPLPDWQVIRECIGLSMGFKDIKYDIPVFQI